MKMLKYLSCVCFAAAFVSSAHALVPISASSVTDSFGTPYPLARLCFLPVNAADQASGFRNGSIQVLPVETCGKVTSGVLQSLSVVANIAGTYYHIRARASNGNTVLRDFGITPITGVSWSLDTYDQNLAVLPVSAISVGTITTGAPGSAASCTVTGGSPALLNCTVPQGPQGIPGTTTATGTSGDFNVPGALTAKSINGCYNADGTNYTTIQAAITAAGTTGCVIIQPNYPNTDAYINPNNISIRDLRLPGRNIAGAIPSFVDVDKRALRQVTDTTRPLGLSQSQGSVSTVSGNANLSLGSAYNLAQNSENIGAVGYSVTAAGVIHSTDTITWNGVTLGRVTGTAFYDGLYQNLNGSGITSLTPGTMYLFSEYVLNNQPLEQLLPQLGAAVVNGVGVWASHLVDKNVRRVWFACVALTSSTVDCGTQQPTTALGSGAGGHPTWIQFGNGYPALVAADYPGVSNALDVYVGGFQIEAITTEKQGVVVIGDSKTQFDCGGTSGSANSWDASNCSSWTRWASGVLNVPFFNRGIGGQKCSDMDSRWATDITPVNVRAKYAVIDCGGNDIAAAATLSAIQTSINSMVSKATTDGYIPVVTTYEPTLSLSGNSSFESEREQLNQWIRQTFPRVLDIAAVMEDPYDISSIRRVNGWYSSDGVHELWRARRAVGEYVGLSYVGNPYGYPQIFDFQRPRPYQPVPTTTPTRGGAYSGTTLALSGTVINYGGVPTVANGVPSLLAKVDTTGLSTNVALATLYTVPTGGAGTYRLSCYEVITTAATTSSTLAQCLGQWTDNDTSTVLTAGFGAAPTTNTVGTTNVSGSNPTAITFQAKAGTVIKYGSQNYASSGATAMQYAIHPKLEYLGN